MQITFNGFIRKLLYNVNYKTSIPHITITIIIKYFK